MFYADQIYDNRQEMQDVCRMISCTCCYPYSLDIIRQDELLRTEYLFQLGRLYKWWKLLAVTSHMIICTLTRKV
jgi:hypothetical protein